MTRIPARLHFLLAGMAALFTCAIAASHPAPRCSIQAAAASALTDDAAADAESLSVIAVHFRPRSSFNTDNEYGKYVQTTVRVGWRVRASADYGNVKKGMMGTYYGTNGGEPPCLVVWDPDVKASSTLLPNVPADKASHASWVHWHEVEIVDMHP